MDCRKLSADACMHAVQNERLPLRVVVQVLFFEQVRAAAAAGGAAGGGALPLPAAVRSLLPRENCGSHSSSMSGATTNTVEDWDAEDLKSIKPVRLVNEESRSSSGSGEVQKHGGDRSSHRSRGIPMAKGILGKLLSGKHQGGENSSSDTSGSPGSTNLEVPKSTPSRNARHSVS